MKLFYLIISAVILTTNPLFAMDELVRDKLGLQGRVSLKKSSFTASVKELKGWLEEANDGVRGWGPSSIFVDSEICKIVVDDWATLLLSPEKNGQEPKYCWLSGPRPDSSKIYCENIRLHPDEIVPFEIFCSKGTFQHESTWWGLKSPQIILIPQAYANFNRR